MICKSTHTSSAKEGAHGPGQADRHGGVAERAGAGMRLRLRSLLRPTQLQGLALQQSNLLCSGACWGPSWCPLCWLSTGNTGPPWHVPGAGFCFLFPLLLLSLYISEKNVLFCFVLFLIWKVKKKRKVLRLPQESKMPFTSHFTLLLLFALELCTAALSVNDQRLSS